MAGGNLEQFIEKIEKVGAKSGINPLEGASEPEVRVAPNKEHFDSLYTQQTDMDVRKVDTSRVSIVDEVSNVGKKVDQMKIAPSTEQLVAQAEEAVGKIRELKEKLNGADVSIKPEYKSNLRNQLSHMDETIKVTLNKAGVEYHGPVAETSSKNPIQRFLGYLENGQNQLETLGSEVQKMHATNQTLSPSAMLAVQYKVGIVQQQIEFFTGVLNKALESTKTIMNVQV
jgi:vacuolar-type H+-ATPase subunit I/STV1